MYNRLLLVLTVMLLTNSVSAQYIMRVELNDNRYKDIPVSDIKQVTFIENHSDPANWKNPSPIISLIDDDTRNPEDVKAFHDLCTDNGIVGTWATIASCGEKNPEVFRLLHQYEAEGFHAAFHCYLQRDYYRWNDMLHFKVNGITHVGKGDVYRYRSNGKDIDIPVIEMQLGDDGSGVITFDFMSKYYHVPESSVGHLERVSGTGDAVICFTDYEVQAYRDETKVREDMSKAQKIFADEGFLDMEYFVSPYGSNDEGLQQIARDMGFECLVSTASQHYMDNAGTYGRYNIQRFSLDPADRAGRELSLLKSLIDQAAANNGWVLACMHIYNGWTQELKETRFKEFVDYAKSKGVRFVTLKEGFAQYKSVFDHYNN